jgi:hypothetical protein
LSALHFTVATKPGVMIQDLPGKMLDHSKHVDLSFKCPPNKSFLLIAREPLFVGAVTWLRHYAASPKVAGSIPDEVIGFFN